MFVKKPLPEKTVAAEPAEPEVAVAAPIVPLVVRHRPEIVVDRRAAAIAARLAR